MTDTSSLREFVASDEWQGATCSNSERTLYLLRLADEIERLHKDLDRSLEQTSNAIQLLREALKQE